jgi:phytol kinase
MLSEFPFVLIITVGVLGGLYIANLMYDAGIPHHVSRKVSHIAGGVGFLLFPLFFSSFWWPLVIVCGFTVLLLITHIYKPDTFRGTGGTGRLQAFAEVHYPAVAIPIIAVCWGVLNEPWLAIVPLLYLAFGDAATGLIRNHFYNREVKGIKGSVGMLVVCLLLAYLFEPYYIAVIGAVVATIAEKYTPTKQYLDDNLSVPLVSALVMGVIYVLVQS